MRLKTFLVESELILAAWDAYSGEHSDADGWPFDEAAYGWRMVQRDAETRRAFLPLQPCARQLLALAAVQIQRLGKHGVAPHWACHLRELGQALEHLEGLRREHTAVRETRRVSGPVPRETFVDSVAEFNEEAWSHLRTWADKGHVLFDIRAVSVTAHVRWVPVPDAAAVRHTARRW
ncbi:hypothetical protein ACIQCR_31215 [Streptomyces sp. NPDC093249]|uniref:hypothetical protein n=1 Tax=unclassified Streptomyces TaxID=2593676 RepID=UPI00344C9478